MYRTSFFASTGVLLLALLGAPSRTLGDDPGQWLGKKVLPVNAEIALHYDYDEARMVGTWRSWAVATVKRVDKGDVWARAGSWEGRVAQDDVVPLDEAIDYFTTRIGSYPEDDFAYAQRALAHRELNQLELSIQDYDEAIKLNPLSAEWFNNRAHAHETRKDFDKAIADYSEAIRIDPQFVLAFNNRGIAYRIKGELDKSIQDCTESIRLYSRCASAYHNLGAAYFLKNDLDRAVKNYSEAILIDPNGAKIRCDRGDAYCVRKEYAKALVDYTEAIRLDPNEANAYGALAWLLATCPEDKVRNGKLAVAHADKACALTNWRNAAHLDTLAAAYAENGEFELARKWQTLALKDLKWKKENGDGPGKRLKLYVLEKPFRDVENLAVTVAGR